MLTYEAESPASPPAAWALMSRPARWKEWAPHIRGAWWLGAPEVQVGRRGVVRVLGAPLVPARITAKRAGRMWAWKVGPIELTHRVEPRGRGAVVAVDIDAPAPLEPALAATYGPLVQVLMNRLARKADTSRVDLERRLATL